MRRECGSGADTKRIQAELRFSTQASAKSPSMLVIALVIAGNFALAGLFSLVAVALD